MSQLKEGVDLLRSVRKALDRFGLGLTDFDRAMRLLERLAEVPNETGGELEYDRAEFLEVRAGYIRQMEREGSSMEEIAYATGTDPTQARMIAMSGPIDHGLRARILAESAPAWVPCSERLPEPDVEVLTIGALYGSTKIRIAFRTEHNWITHMGSWALTDVTHWAPLPALPKGSA